MAGRHVMQCVGGEMMLSRHTPVVTGDDMTDKEMLSRALMALRRTPVVIEAEFVDRVEACLVNLRTYGASEDYYAMREILCDLLKIAGREVPGFDPPF